MSPASHLVTVWNPSYAESAIDAHLEVLVGAAKEAWAGGDAPYVWWAKLRSPNRQGPLPHRDEVLALGDQLNAGVETHLYLTYYRSLYVGGVEEITADAVRQEMPGELDRMPAYFSIGIVSWRRAWCAILMC
jgi:hypothetical protein